MNAVLLKDITFSYDGKTKILDGVDFHADYGEISLIAGHSGEGKSTLASIICGIIPNVNSGTLEGQVIIDGENIDVILYMTKTKNWTENTERLLLTKCLKSLQDFLLTPDL